MYCSILGNLIQHSSQKWETDFEKFMATKYGTPIAGQQTNLNWTEQFLDGAKEHFLNSKTLIILGFTRIIFPENYLIIFS